MKRSEFLAIADLDLTTYKNLRHRGQFPFLEKIEGHTDFTVAHAVQTWIMGDLMLGGFMSPSMAGWLTSEVWRLIGHGWRSDIEGLSHAGIWAGFSVVREGLGRGEYILEDGEAYGTLESCVSELAKGGRAGRIIMVNVSCAAETVLRRVGGGGVT